MAEVKCEIVKKIGVLSETKSGWTKDLNLVSWNEHEPKYDIRDWSSEGKPGKGVTLTSEELKALKELLSSIEIK